VEIPGCIINMRHNRTNMVQTAVKFSDRNTYSSGSSTHKKRQTELVLRKDKKGHARGAMVKTLGNIYSQI